MNNLLDDSKIKNIMNRIQSRRLELKLSYQDLASKTNMSKSTLQRYETGSIKNMPVDKLGIIATALDVSPLWLLGFDENENNNKLSKEEQNHIDDLRKLNDIGKEKVITYTKDLLDNPKFNKNNNNMCCTSIRDIEYIDEDDGYVPRVFAAHSDDIDEETNRRNIEMIKRLEREKRRKKTNK